MQPGFCRVHRSHMSEPKAEKCFYLNKGWNHPRDYVKVVTLSGQSSNARDVTLEMDRVPIVAATPDVGEAAGPEPWGPDVFITYLPPVAAGATRAVGTAGAAGAAGATAAAGDIDIAGAAGAAGTAGYTGIAGAAGTAGDAGTASDDAGDVVDATDGGTADEGDAAVIPGGE